MITKQSIPVPPLPVDYQEVMRGISAIMAAVSVELDSVSTFKNEAETSALFLLHRTLGTAHSLAHLILAVRRELGVTDHDIRARLALSYIEAVLGA